MPSDWRAALWGFAGTSVVNDAASNQNRKETPGAIASGMCCVRCPGFAVFQLFIIHPHRMEISFFFAHGANLNSAVSTHSTTMGKWLFGKDNSGDIRKKENIEDVWSRCHELCAEMGTDGAIMVTADGSVDCQDRPSVKTPVCKPSWWPLMAHRAMPGSKSFRRMKPSVKTPDCWSIGQPTVLPPQQWLLEAWMRPIPAALASALTDGKGPCVCGSIALMHLPECREDPNEQERHTAPLHYCELVTALGMLAHGGSFVLKVSACVPQELSLRCCTLQLLVLRLCRSEVVDVWKLRSSGVSQ
eukprot:1160704-Pelagomonas_calceolata.AAC.9